MASSTKDRQFYSNDIFSPGYIESTASSTRKSKEKLRVDSLIPSEILENSAGMKQLLEAYYTFMNLDEFIYAENEDFQDIVLDGKAVFRISDPRNENDAFFTDEQGADSTMSVTDAAGTVTIIPLNDINVNISNGNELPGSLALETSEIGKTFQVLIPDVTKKSAGVSAVVDVNGVVTVLVGDLGYQYPTAPTITIAAPDSGTQATASVQLVTTTNSNPYLDTLGSLQLTITNGGSGYTAENPPTVTIAANPDDGEVTFAPNSSTAKLNTPIKNWVGPGPSHVLNNIERAMDIDNNSVQFLELMQKEIASVIPRNITVNKRNLYKNIVDYYKVRGSADSIEIFFRLLFNDEVEVQYPWDKTLIPSSGNWDQPINVDSILASAVNNSSTLVLTQENQEIRLSSRLSVNDVYSKTDDIRVTSVLGSSITVSRPKKIIFDARNASVVNLSTDTIILSAADIVKFPTNTKLTYIVPENGTAIGGLVSGNDYFVISNSPSFIQLSSTEGGSAINLTSTGLLNEHELIRYIKLANNSNITFHPKGQYLDNKGQLSNVIKIQDSLRYQKFSYLIRTGQNVSTWENVFNRLVHPAGFKFFGEILIIMELTKAVLGEDTIEGDTLYRKVLSAMPERQPGAIGIEDLPLLVEMFASTFLPAIKSRIHRGGTISIPNSKLKNGVISTITVTNAGSGYLAPPTVTTVDTGTPSGHTAGTFTPVITSGGLASVTIVDGGKDYDIPGISFAAPTALTFDGSDDESVGVGIINLVDNTIKLTAAQAAVLPVGATVTYNSGGGTSIGGLTSGASYFIMTNVANEVTLQSVLGGTQTDITSVGSGTAHNFIGQTAVLSPTKTDGIVTGIEISDPGYGYTSAPAITFNGVAIASQSLVQPNISIGLDAQGRLDVDNITITSGGSGYLNAFGFVAANPNYGSLAAIDIAGLGDKNYSKPPSIVISEPTAKDADGVLLSSNVQAAAEFVFDSSSLKYMEVTSGGTGYTSAPTVTIGGNATGYAMIENGSVTRLSFFTDGAGYTNGTNYTTVPTVTISGGGGSGATGIAHINEGEISGYSITQAGSGYTGDPVLRIDSGGHNEIRGKDIRPILKILVNHLANASRTRPENNYFNRKGNTYLNSAKRYGANDTLETLAQVQIQSTEITNINNSNVNSFIHKN